MTGCHIKTEKLGSWIPNLRYPLIVSGPCSAETEEQLMSTARAISRIPNCRVLRAGIWKPRTRPNIFEGVGEIGLKWMKRASEETGLLTAVEVANPTHIELALKYGIDILWIGARTVVNPFSVQEISDAMQGVNLPVMVKNPLHPDINLWVGAIERLNNAGVEKIIAVHRGFHQFSTSIYRNDPMWEIPIELMRHCPDLPVICDPSHISGNRKLIQQISQRALDLAIDGLMIETHINPDQALTDNEQQLTPVELEDLLGNLKLRHVDGSKEFQDKLEELRVKIDFIDEELIDILSRRMDIVKEIGNYKKDHDVTVLQLRRWTKIIDDRLAKGIVRGLEKDFLVKLLQLVHKESIQAQMRILNKNGNGNGKPE